MPVNVESYMAGPCIAQGEIGEELEKKEKGEKVDDGRGRRRKKTRFNGENDPLFECVVVSSSLLCPPFV